MNDPLTAAKAGDERAFAALVEPHRRELRAYCYRMAGSLDEADDLLQESLLRAWRGLGTFEGRSSLRTWLYRVAWSACLDALEKRPPRVLSYDLGPPARPSDPFPPPKMEGWIGPCPPSLYEGEAQSPEARFGSRESVALAFLAALQLLPPRQRATLILRDVLGFSAEETADVLEATVPSLNSALQRARETMAARAGRWKPRLPDEPSTRALLERYVAAWESADVAQLVSLLREDATLSMPPVPLWLRGPADIGTSIGAMVLTPETRGAFALVAAEANGVPGFAAYKRGDDGAFHFVALHLVTLDDGDRIADMIAFLDPRLAGAFGLAETLVR
jgi:RNA polymerase sigma-70 factor (ECF subfamily)